MDQIVSVFGGWADGPTKMNIEMFGAHRPDERAKSPNSKTDCKSEVGAGIVATEPHR